MVEELANNNGDDASSNPNADEHLPTAGEFKTAHVPYDSTITEIDDDDEVEDPNDMNEISSKHTDEIAEAPDPDGPANLAATGDRSY